MFCTWDVLHMGCFAHGMFCIWIDNGYDLHMGTFCIWVCFVYWYVLYMSNYVSHMGTFCIIIGMFLHMGRTMFCMCACFVYGYVLHMGAFCICISFCIRGIILPKGRPLYVLHTGVFACI